MTNGELFIVENPNIEFKINGSCVWIYFDGVNYYTMPVSWWDKEIGLFDKIQSEIEERIQVNQCLNIDRANALCWCLDVIDKYKEGSERMTEEEKKESDEILNRSCKTCRYGMLLYGIENIPWPCKLCHGIYSEWEAKDE